ncbi:MAG: hypothetical protein LBD84_01655 [Campylobacteraceae bacterium]|nr:hypothetical protein [Campylobacteraceae bacterium]
MIKNVSFYIDVNDVQEIDSQEGLNAIRDDLSGKYVLTKDIKLTDLDAVNGWEPIGNANNRFTGILSGNNYAITDLWIDRPSNPRIGLFGVIENAQIKNLNVETAEGKEVKGKEFVGAIVGYALNSSITNSSSAGNVGSYANNIGGIAGAISDSNITNSYSTVNINSFVSTVGGIVGVAYYDNKIANSYSAGNISSDQQVGGIVGYAGYGISNVTNSYSTGNIAGVNLVGGIAGVITYSGSSITNSYSTGSIKGNNEIGGILGRIYDGVIVKNNAAINTAINGADYVNRIIGQKDGGTPPLPTDNFALDAILVNGAVYSATEDGFSGTNKTIEQFKDVSTYESLLWAFGDNDNSPWKIDADKNDGLPYFYWQEL